MPAKEQPRRRRLGLPIFLFALTVVSVFSAGTLWQSEPIDLPGNHAPEGALSWLQVLLPELWRGWTFAVPLLTILLAHEFGHYIAARLHKVEASLPYFLPLPLLSPFGTLGAVIAMPNRIRSRNALLDIGAAGPIAGMIVAIPVMAIGLAHSEVLEASTSGYVQEGQSLLYLLMKRIFVGPIPPGYDVMLHPTALAGWVGFLITMINLLPWGQLDGGHIGYALFLDRHHRVGRWVRAALIPLFFYNVVVFVLPIMLGKSQMSYFNAFSNSSPWAIWFIVLAVLARFAGPNHPPTEHNHLSPSRRWVAWGCLVLFLLLFMPTPWAVY